MSKKEEVSPKAKAPKKDHSEAKATFVRGILGIVLLLVFGSIMFSTVVIWGGTDTLAPKLMTIPAAAFDVVLAFVAFSKILK